MLRVLVCCALSLCVASPVLADAESDAIVACQKWIKRDGIATQVSPGYSASGSGDHFEVATRATVGGRANKRITCKVSKGRVTRINYG